MLASRPEKGWEARRWPPIVIVALCLAASLQVQVCRGQDPRCGRDYANATCSGGLCCSSAGYCGTTNDYCGSGCQSNCQADAPADAPGSGAGTCSSTNVCANNGCCSQYGFCGTTPDYCGSGCQSGPCQADAPGSGASTCSSTNVCANNGCCNKYGFCGTTPDYCGSGCQSGPCSSGGRGLSAGAYVGTAVGVVGALLFLLAIFVMCRRRRLAAHKRMLGEEDLESRSMENDDHDLLRIPGNLYNHTMRLPFDKLKSATNGFTEELGRGAFGVVYKGTLEDGTELAVKKLLENERGLKDFEVEVKTLGSINHANLVALLGFCFERNQRYVIYEYVTNGSLDKSIFMNEVPDRKSVLPWTTRVDILKGTAKGLAYLHEDLQVGQAIIHLDIKPENILLDEFYVPKVADFGMAKLVGPKRATETLASGGTVGYMAPEVYAGAATPKMDVYSFGIVLLEVLSGRRHLERSLPRDSVYLPAWSIRKVRGGEELDIIDPLVKGMDFKAEEAKRLILVALLCLQRDPEERPQMSTVLRFMEGITVPGQLPPTLQSELEMTERLVLPLNRPPAKGSEGLISLNSAAGEEPSNATSSLRQRLSPR